MSDPDFRKLIYATHVVNRETLFRLQTGEWEAKRYALAVQLADIPTLLRAHQTRTRTPHPGNPRITLADPIPTMRLANACEATVNCVYSMAEIASSFANKASKGLLPSSFNKLRKMCEEDPAHEVAVTLGDLQWYRKVRELRTEWVHYSSISIDEDQTGTTKLYVRAYRRPSDKIEFRSPNFSCTVDELFG